MSILGLIRTDTSASPSTRYSYEWSTNSYNKGFIQKSTRQIALAIAVYDIASKLLNFGL